MQRGERGREKEVPVPGQMDTNPSCAPGGSGHASLELTPGSAHLSRDGKIHGGAVFHGEVGVIILRGFEQ